jgi:hypothetical protein
VVIVGAIVIAVVVFLLVQQQRRRRRRALHGLAALLKFQCYDRDPFATMTLPFGLFERGDGRGVDLLMSGTRQKDGGEDVPVRLFDYWYYEQTSDGRGGRSRTYHRFTCSVSLIAGVACPRLSVKHEGLLSKIGQHIGFGNIDFESEEYNRMFQVTSEDKKFAYAMIDAGMIDFMIKTGGLCAFEVVGPYLLVTMKKLAPPDWRALLNATMGVHTNVPPAVREMYPGTGPMRGSWS